MKAKFYLSILLIACVGSPWVQSIYSSQKGYLSTLKGNDPVLGQKNVVVLFASFADINFSMSRDVMEQRISVATSYFNEVSYGQIAISFSFDNETLYLPHNLTNYGSTYFGFQGYAQLVTDSVLAASAVNFTRFDYVLLVHSGNSQQQTNNTKYPETCVIQPVQIMTNDGEVMFEPAILSEFDASLLFCHEIGHLLGLPDLYPSAAYTSGDVGCWDLMGQYSPSEYYGNPPELSAWSRIKLGWINDSVIKTVNMSDTEDTTMLSALETAPFWYGDTKVIKVEITADSYYLVELRNQINSDVDLPSSGILIYRCDDEAQSVNVIDTSKEDFRSPGGF